MASPRAVMSVRPGQLRRRVALAARPASTSSPSQSTSPAQAAALGPVAPATTVAGQTTVASTVRASVTPAVEQAIKQAVQDFFAAYMACGQAPAQCHAADFHSSSGTAVGQGTVYFQGLVGARRTLRAGSPRFLRRHPIRRAGEPHERRHLLVLVRRVDPARSPDAKRPAAVLNDTIISVREKQALYLDGTEWKVGEAATVQDLGDGNQCPPPDAET